MARTVVEGLAHGSPLVVAPAFMDQSLPERALWNGAAANATSLSAVNRGV
ncbi:hypothetical protein PCLA_01f0272 [Pseudomonas citronellolis]|nr:hypothetical protein PCLA_01f0272 [Pseudomonas citronellolis]